MTTPFPSSSLNDASAQLFAIALAATWCGLGLYGVVRKIERSSQARELLERFRRARLSTKAAFVAGLIAVVATGGTKPGGNEPRNAPNTRTDSVSSVCSVVEPSVAPVEVRTNAVALLPESASAVEVTDWRKHGSATGGVWLDFDEPFFRIGTNPVSRAYVAANGAISFDTTRRPPVGAPLPDGTGLPSIAPLLAPLGMVPEANWGGASRPGEPLRSRFWHDEAPGRGRVFTWENALLDRLPGRRVSVQAELLPSGDFTYRYDFADALDPPATNLVLGAQVGTNGVNALAVLGTNLLAETVWRVDGARVTNGVSIAGLLCTNGALRAPARFAIEWKNTSGLDLNADTDGDGIPDRDEVFRHGTDPNRSDTDGDGLSDSAEVLAGADPLDADENGDGVPDGVAPAAWTANPLWAANGGSTDCTIVLDADLPAGTKASLSLNDLTIPLSRAGSWNIDLPAGQFVAVRLFSTGEDAIPLSLLPTRGGGSSPPLRGGARSGYGPPRAREDPDGVFDGAARNADAGLAEPTMRIVCGDGSTPPPDQCRHDYDPATAYRLDIQPAGIGLSTEDATLSGFQREGADRLVLPADNLAPGDYLSGSAEISAPPLDYGTLYDSISIHHCEEEGSWWCPYCLMYHSHDHGCEHEPDCPMPTGSGDCTCPPRVVRVSEGTNVHSVATCFVGTSDCCCPPPDSALRAVLDFVDGNLVVSNSTGVLGPGDCFEGPVVVFATAPSGNAPSEIRYRLVGEDATGATTNLAQRTAKIWAVRIRHEPVTLDRVGDAYWNPCGIVTNETANFRFSLEPEAFPATNIAWSVDRPDRLAFVGGANGRSVVVRGTAEGLVKLSVGIRGYRGPPPVFYAGVVEPHVVHIKPYVVATGNGNPILDDAEIASFVPGVNRIFSQVGLRFILDLPSLAVANTNYLVLRKENGTYPLGLSLLDEGQPFDGVKMFFVEFIEDADGLHSSRGIILPAASEEHSMAHELGHACGLEDVLDYVEWRDPANVKHQYYYEGDVARWRLPHDWGTDFDEGYYSVQWHGDVLTRLLMCGRRLSPRTNEDISYGNAHGLVFLSDAQPTNYATCGIGYFTVPTHIPSHD